MDGNLGSYLLKKVMNFMKQDGPRTLQAVRNVGQQDVNPHLSPEVDIVFSRKVKIIANNALCCSSILMRKGL